MSEYGWRCYFYLLKILLEIASLPFEAPQSRSIIVGHCSYLCSSSLIVTCDNNGENLCRLQTTSTSKACLIWLVRRWLTWSRGRLLRRSARHLTSRTTLHPRKRRRFVGRTNGPLNKKELKEWITYMLLFYCRMVMFDACVVCYVKLCDVRWVLTLFYNVIFHPTYLTSPFFINIGDCLLLWMVSFLIVVSS